MKKLLFLSVALVAVAFLSVGRGASAQTGSDYKPAVPSGNSGNTVVGGYGGWGYGSSTAAEGFGRGMADVIRAQGDYNLSTSAAAINMTEARRREVENRKLWTQTYFDMRHINKDSRQANAPKAPSAEDIVRHAQAGKPKRLTAKELDPVTGVMLWPVLLQSNEFAKQREYVEKAFVQRAYDGSMKGDAYLEVQQIANDLIELLKEWITKVPSDQYMSAKRFLQSVAYEAGQPVG